MHLLLHRFDGGGQIDLLFMDKRAKSSNSLSVTVATDFVNNLNDSEVRRVPEFLHHA